MAAASHNTGLDDFGEDGWRTHFQQLLRSIEAEARLNFLGRVLTRADFIRHLEARLLITDWIKQHPEVEQQTIDAPVFIMGLGRSGTTILFELLSQDPQFRVVRKWEAMYPCPPPEPDTYTSDARIALSEKVSAFQDHLLPEFQTMHKMGGHLPVESVEFLYLTFLSEVYPILFQVPSYSRYLAEQGQRSTFEWHKRILKLLQSKFEKRRWLIKSPSHLPYLADIRHAYPDAKFIFTHRDPIVSADSIVSVQGAIYWWRTDNLDGEWSQDGGNGAAGRAGIWQSIIDSIERGELKESDFANFQYHQFMANPMDTVRSVYDQLGLELSAEALANMQAFLKDKPQGKFGKHEYDHVPDDILSEERAIYRPYQQYFDIPDEC